ncbi:Na+/H+ antiporter subunit E [Actinomadura livida]|uniref:Multicomponent Na+:H+ antiporter subunit E n=1 Tax=Actinomadura livida TaxID=79909 RepID=A0A7W7IH36_9ACTN|nr:MULTISPECIES: Na+/H+ antiporter subunit E [Actinomadura]MBB4776613.1 multicomponent Na+:H+ antiporter subunit E [Actinomadura catellatispora]GGT93532.1 Na+/H+ antiporter subunit E [Actinomadura livida]
MNRNARRAASRVLMGVWLLGIWLLLWGRIDALTVAGGAVVVAGAYAASRLPAVPLVRRIRPLRVAAVIAEFAWDLLVSSVVIGWHALYRPRQVRSGIIDVDMRSRSELILLGVTTSISLRPGTILIDLDPDRTVLRIHAMPVRSRAEADSRRAGVATTEERLMRAFVTWEDAPPEEDDR